MNFKNKISQYLLLSFIILGFQKVSCMEVAREIASSAIAGAAARTLIFENLPGFFKSESNKDDKDSNSKHASKTNWKKWAHGGSALINCFNIALAAPFIFRSKNMNNRAQWGTRWVYLLAAIVGCGFERGFVEALKDSKMLEKNKDAVDASMPVALAALQYLVTK
jgi:hypothetical protein